MKNKTIAYLRISTDKQNNENQEHGILRYCQEHKIIVDEFIKVQMSSGKSEDERQIKTLIDSLNSGDTVLFTELSRLGRKMVDTLTTTITLWDKAVNVIFTEQLYLNSSGNRMMDEMKIAVFGGIAQEEKKRLQERTKLALQRLKSQGVQLGHRQDFLKSKYDDYEKAIYDFREVNKLSFPKICTMLDPKEKLGFKAQSMRLFFNARYELEPTFQTYQPTKKYSKIYNEKNKV